MEGEFINLVASKKTDKQPNPTAWLAENSVNLPRYALVTHIGKYTHPDVQIAFWDDSDGPDTGYLTTASAGKRQDIVVTGGAAYMSMAALLTRTLSDGKTVLEHFQADTSLIREDVAALGLDYEKLRCAVLALQRPAPPKKSDHRLKQVYFPVREGEYHLLSTITSTTVLSTIRDAVLTRRQQAVESRDKKSERYGEAYTELVQPAKIAFGGSKPQNLSCVNDLSGMYMLPSVPPLVAPRKLRFPHRNFFFDSIARYWQADLFQCLHHWIQSDLPRRQVKEQIEIIGWELAENVQLLALQIREAPPNWSDGKNLSEAQCHWLDAKYTEERTENISWIKEVSRDFGYWVISAYKFHAKLKKGTTPFGDAELRYFAAMLNELLQEEVRQKL